MPGTSDHVPTFDSARPIFLVYRSRYCHNVREIFHLYDEKRKRINKSVKEAYWNSK